MTLISFRDGAVVMQYGTDGTYKVGTGDECCDLPRCCPDECTCECEVTVTYAGITFPADGVFRAICVDEDGPFIFGLGIPGGAAMGAVSAVVGCYGGAVFVELLNIYQLISKVNNAFPQAGEVCTAWLSTGNFQSFGNDREYAWVRCNDCGCPDPAFPPRYIQSFFLISLGDLPCADEYNPETRTEPVFEIDCGPCP